MSFRVRLTLLVCAALAVLVVATSFVTYFTDRSELIGQVDADLASNRHAAILALAPAQARRALAPTRPPTGPSLIRRAGFAVLQTGSPNTFVLVPSDNQSTMRMTVDWRVPHANVAAHLRPASPVYSTQPIEGVSSRVMTSTFSGGIIRISRSLVEVDRNLAHLRWLLTLISLGGIAGAAALGLTVSRAAVAPLRRLTETTDRIIESGDLRERVGAKGRDEISRLSSRLDELLATLERSLRAQRQLVADASHELRTPIASIRANFDVLDTPGALSEGERAELLADVRGELESVTTLVTGLLELARGDELEEDPRDFRLDETVKTAVDAVARRTPGVAFRSHLEPSVINGWPERVERAVTNLLDNARKWSPPGGTVDVVVREGVVEVRDQGPGIDPEDRPLVFNRFYRSAKARGTPGSGLGLAIVQQVAEAHGGAVTVDQSSDGGAVLRLQLTGTG